MLDEKFRLPHVTVYEWGLGASSGMFPMDYEGTAGCTYLVEKPGERAENEYVAERRSIIEELARVGEVPDFLMMNCEGSESSILRCLAEHGVLHRFPQVLVQFHPPLLGERVCETVLEEWGVTHQLKWRWGWGWIYGEAR